MSVRSVLAVNRIEDPNQSNGMKKIMIRLAVSIVAAAVIGILIAQHQARGMVPGTQASVGMKQEQMVIGTNAPALKMVPQNNRATVNYHIEPVMPAAK